MVGGSALTMNASLASALATHKSNNEPPTAGGRNTRKKTSIHALTVHPSLPRVAYLEEETVISILPNTNVSTNKRNKGSSPKSAKADTSSSTTKSQRLVIQLYNNQIHKTHNGGGSQSSVLASLPLEKLPSQINKFRQPKSKSSKITNQPLTLASLGPLQSITFLDRDALFWQTRRQYGKLTNLDISTSALMNSGSGEMINEEEAVLYSDSDMNNVDGIMGKGLCLGLQFERVLVVLQFNNNYNIHSADENITVLCCLEGQRTNASSGKEIKVQYTPTSSAVPITNSIVVYGCSDGAMRFHNLVPSMLYSSKDHAAFSLPSSSSSSIGGGGKSSNKQTRQATIKSVRGPNGRNDPVVKIVNVDPAYNEVKQSKDLSLSSIPTQAENGTGTISDDTTLVIRSRLLTVCTSGVAYLWDVHVLTDRASGALRDMNVLPPLVRLDGLGILTMSPRASPASSSPQDRPTGGFWAVAEAAKSNEGSSQAPYSQVAPVISYDPNRHLLTWALPSDAPVSSVDHGGDYELESVTPKSSQAKKDQDDQQFLSKWVEANGGFVKVWDMSLVDALIGSAASAPSSSPRPPPKMPPIAIMKMPTSLASTTIRGGVIVGLPHAPLSCAALACSGLSTDGSKLLLYAAPLPMAIDNTYENQESGTQSSSSIISPVKPKKKIQVKPKLLYVNYTPCHEVPLANDGSLSLFARGSSVSASYLAPDILAVASDQGVAIANVANGESWSTKTALVAEASEEEDKSNKQQHASNLLAGPIHALISIGGVGNRQGIVFVENHAVYTSRLATSSSSNDSKQQLVVKKVELQDPIMLCQLHGKHVPWKTTRLTRMSTFVESSKSMSCHPRLISSPSGRYLCLYWKDEKTYEILHAGSLLARDGPVPTFDSVVQQHVTPFVDSGKNVMSFAWVGDDDNFAILRQNEDLSLFPEDRSQDDAFNIDTTDDFIPSKKKQGRPKVELYKLAEVKVDAVELAAGASVAAATTVSLGSLTIRGGDRVIPTHLFGGPSLCVGCISMSDRSDLSDNVTYFYSRRSAALEKNDERASAYLTIGTSIPHPDLVTWDDSGQLCAVSYGTRVALYLSEESKFILLGSIRIVGSSSNSDLSLISMKFIHGVLFCSTQSSVHAIFMGDLGENDTVCELDAFEIATSGVPLYGLDNPDVSSPAPIITALSQPYILSYHSGGLLVSTSCGLRLLPLSHPIIRIGTLLAANLVDRARKWIVAMPKAEHESLAHFLIRRGHVDLALRDLNGLSLETYIDLCMRFERTGELEHLIYNHSELASEISDWGREENGNSAFLSIGIYLLGKGKVDCVKHLIAQAIESGLNELLVDAMKLSNFVAAVDQPEGNDLAQKVTSALHFDEKSRQVALVNNVI